MPQMKLNSIQCRKQKQNKTKNTHHSHSWRQTKQSQKTEQSQNDLEKSNLGTMIHAKFHIPKQPSC